MAMKTKTAKADPPGYFFTFKDQYAYPSKSLGYAHFLAADIAAELTANGWPCELANPTIVSEVSEALAPPYPGFALNFNLFPIKTIDVDVAVNGGSRQIGIYELLSAYLRRPMICVLLDQAFHVLTEIERNPYAVDSVHFAYFEKSCLYFLLQAGVPRARTVHITWGGPPPDPNPKPIKDRGHDLVFHGRLSLVELDKGLIGQIMSPFPASSMIDLMHEVAGDIVNKRLSVYAALLAGLKNKNIASTALSHKQTAFLAHLADRISRNIRRERFLLAFTDMSVNFFGEFPDSFKIKFSRATFHGTKPYEEVMDFSRDAKIMLCENLNWRSNIHPRATYAMAQGCVVLAERNDTLDKSFADMKTMILTSHPYEDAAGKAAMVLENSALGQGIVDAARPIYESRHTWRETINALAPFLPPRKHNAIEKKSVKSKSAKAKSPRSKPARTARSPAPRRRG